MHTGSFLPLALTYSLDLSAWTGNLLVLGTTRYIEENVLNIMSLLLPRVQEVMR